MTSVTGPQHGARGLDWGRLVGTPGDDLGPRPVPGVAGGEVAEMIRCGTSGPLRGVVVVGSCRRSLRPASSEDRVGGSFRVAR